MLTQYSALKQKYADTILLFRLGDFYEGFADDAKILSKILGITLTGRGKDANRVEMAGIPYHALEQYLPKLIKAGVKVAIAEQLEAPTPGKIVERDVVKVITAGTLINENVLDEPDNNYLASVYLDKKTGNNGLAFADLSTGEFQLLEISGAKGVATLAPALVFELERLRCKELILPRSLAEQSDQGQRRAQKLIDDREYNLGNARKLLQDAFAVKSLKGFGIDEYSAGIMAAAELYKYLQQTQRTELAHITKLSVYHTRDYMLLDQATIRNLELIYPLNPGEQGRTVFEVLNNCKTAMGQRKLRSWLLHPLLTPAAIETRQNVVAAFSESEIADSVQTKLTEIADLERILARIGTKSCNARDLKFLARSLESAMHTFGEIVEKGSHVLATLLPAETETINKEVIMLLESAIADDPPVTITEGKMIAAGYNSELDEIKEIEHSSKDFLTRLQRQEIERTGITSLKVRFNNVFGYYIEISQSNLDKVPAHYVRKQTLTNAERFITDELKEYEEKILGAEERAAALEYKLFEEIRSQVLAHVSTIQVWAERIAEIDVLLNFAQLARERNYVRPVVAADIDTVITAGRHPVVELQTSDGEQVDFIANDITFDEKQNLIVLTGPNMSGKSTYIRQIALICLLAQIGSSVPASHAQIRIADRVFTRVGASDNLAGGESTFMVEMNETANILNNATENSLLILDEVGRGTSTYDGVAIAWAVAEYIATQVKARTLFATHYHELMELESKFDTIKNYNVAVSEENGKVSFLRKVVSGGTDQSYGIHVAEIAGLPKAVVRRAHDILSTLEQQRDRKLSKAAQSPVNFSQLNFVDALQQSSATSKLREQLEQIDINALTPVDALLKLKEIKEGM